MIAFKRLNIIVSNEHYLFKFTFRYYALKLSLTFASLYVLLLFLWSFIWSAFLAHPDASTEHGDRASGRVNASVVTQAQMQIAAAFRALASYDIK